MYLILQADSILLQDGCSRLVHLLRIVFLVVLQKLLPILFFIPTFLIDLLLVRHQMMELINKLIESRMLILHLLLLHLILYANKKVDHQKEQHLNQCKNTNRHLNISVSNQFVLLSLCVLACICERNCILLKTLNTVLVLKTLHFYFIYNNIS